MPGQREEPIEEEEWWKEKFVVVVTKSIPNGQHIFGSISLGLRVCLYLSDEPNVIFFFLFLCIFAQFALIHDIF